MKMRKGFTLIELMIVIAIIAIIAAIAIPNLMASRIRANEATAMTAMKNYNTAQVTFQVGKQGRQTGNTAASNSGYAIDYRALFYGTPYKNTKVNLALISKAHADAFISDSTARGSVVFSGGPTPLGTQTPYAGYHFGNPKKLGTTAVADTEFFKSNFAQVGVPANSTSTGNNAYWVGMQGTVYSYGLTPDLNSPESAYASVSATPSENNFTDWEGL